MTEPALEHPAIAAAIIVRDGKVLMVRRRVAEGELSWQFPAGEVELGETHEEAAVREAAEETGVTVRPVVRIGERVHPATHRSMSYIACEFISGTAHVADPDELADVLWCDRQALSKNVPYPLYGPVSDHLAARLA